MTLHLVYGGTFDPIHLGHLAIAQVARDRLDCTVRFMPAGDPPHRAPPGAGADDRAAMVALAIGHVPGVLLDRRELDRTGRSYTVDTLAELRVELGPAQPLAWLVGADSLLGLPGWHRWRDLLTLAHLVVADRPGSPIEAAALPEPLARALQGRWTDDAGLLHATPAGHLLRLRQPLHPASATDVRARLAAGRATADLLPADVAAFIEEKGLYRPAPAAPL